MIMNSDDRRILESLFLFPSGIPENSGWQIRSFRSGEVIYSPESFEKCLVVILQGRATAKSAFTGALLNSFKPGDVFGAAALFGETDYGSVITAKGDCRAAFFPESYVLSLIKSDPDAAVGYISFLSEKIRFLNRKVMMFTSGSAEGTLARFLLTEADENGQVTLHVPSVKLASLLNISRASLYRVMSVFEEDGAIKKDGKLITLTDPSKLKEYMGETL